MSESLPTMDRTVYLVASNDMVSDKYMLTPERIFIVIGLLFGLLFIFVVPPFQVADEPAHFYRIYQLSEGTLTPQRRDAETGGFIPVSLPTVSYNVLSDLPFHPERTMSPSAITDELFVPLVPERRIFVGFSNTALYSPVPYAPQVGMLWLARLLDIPPLMSMYLGRFAAMIISLIFTWLSIRIAPIGKWLLLILALTPMAAYQRASLSADNITNSLTVLLIALCLYYAIGPVQRLTNRRLALLALLVMLVALTKQTYSILALACCIIPCKKWGGWTRYVVGLAAIFASCVVVNWLWAQIAQQAYAPILAANAPATLRFEPLAQLAFIRAEPWKFVLIVIRTFRVESESYLHGFFGAMGWDVILPMQSVAIITVLVSIVALTDSKPSVHLTWWMKVGMFVIGIAGVLAIMTAGYLLWNKVGNTKIWGIQGRYFIPLGPLFALLLYNNRWPLLAKSHVFRVCFVAATVVMLSYTTVVLLSRYYGFL